MQVPDSYAFKKVFILVKVLSILLKLSLKQ